LFYYVLFLYIYLDLSFFNSSTRIELKRATYKLKSRRLEEHVRKIKANKGCVQNGLGKV
jgi:hypothetical protein